MNVVSKDTIKLLNLKVEPHPNPFRIFSERYNHLDSDVTWIQEDDLRHLNNLLLDCYLYSHSSESSSFQLGGNDGACSRPISRPKRDRKPKFNDEFYYY